MSRRTIVSVALSVLVAASVLPVATSSPHDAPKRCHAPRRFKYRNVARLRAHGPVGCVKARHVSSRWDERCFYRGPTLHQTMCTQFWGGPATISLVVDRNIQTP